jgi:hypothetical protein
MTRRALRVIVLAALAAGAVIAVRRFERLTRVATPEGAARAVGSLAETAQEFLADVRAAAARRETELRAALLTEPSARPTAATTRTDDGGPRRRAASSRPGGWQAGDELGPPFEF